MAARVPATIRAWPRRALSQRRYRSAGPRSAVSVTCRSGLGAAAEQCQGLVDAGQVARVRYDDHGAAARARGGHGGPGDLLRPGRPGQRGPGGAGRAARRDRVEEGGAGRVPGPRAGPGRGGRPPPGSPRPAPCRSRSGRIAGRLARFRGGVALRDREAEHVGQRARVPVGDGARQSGDLRGQHLLGRDDPLQVAEPALVLAAVDPVKDEAIGELAGEPDPDPDAGPGLRSRAVPARGSRRAGPDARAACRRRSWRRGDRPQAGGF